MSVDKLEEEEVTVNGGVDSKTWKERLSLGHVNAHNLPKALVVLFSYTLLFFTLVVQARWFLTSWVKQAPLIHVFEWYQCIPNCALNESEVMRTLSFDSILFCIFMIQHSLLTEKRLSGTLVHKKVFIDWQINGALYTFSTALGLIIMMYGWSTIPIYLWNWPSVKPWVFYIHLLAWLMLYGTTLMQDMPQLVGLHQVVINSDSTSVKSPEFETMLKHQRHLGLVPYFLITVTCEVMTLDRLLFLIILVVYTFSMWRDPVSYPYLKAMVREKQSALTPGRYGGHSEHQEKVD